jgi:hypothetical protein
MSLFRNFKVPCPGCGEDVDFAMVFSVNVDRRPDLRDDIIERTFQSETCEKCNKTFRVQPEFNYLDVGRGQWIAAFPVENLREWEGYEEHAQEVFEKSYGSAAPAVAQEIGEGLTGRVVFGWAALREKIIANQHDLDDITLELCKIAVIRSGTEQPLSNETELRLTDVKGKNLQLAWIVSVTEDLEELMEVPRSLYDEIAADEEGWQQLREELSTGMFVDIDRLMVVPA